MKTNLIISLQIPPYLGDSDCDSGFHVPKVHYRTGKGVVKIKVVERITYKKKELACSTIPTPLPFLSILSSLLSVDKIPKL